MTQRSPFSYFRMGPEIISLVVMLHVRFPLTLRNLEHMLHEHGIAGRYETTPDLSALTKSELEALQRQVQEALSKSEARRRQDAIEAVERAVRDYDFTMQEFLSFASGTKLKRSSGRKGAAAAKFRNPENPNETWSGRGRRPQWFKAQLEAGRSEDDLRV